MNFPQLCTHLTLLGWQPVHAHGACYLFKERDLRILKYVTIDGDQDYPLSIAYRRQFVESLKQVPCRWERIGKARLMRALKLIERDGL